MQEDSEIDKDTGKEKNRRCQTSESNLIQKVRSDIVIHYFNSVHNQRRLDKMEKVDKISLKEYILVSVACIAIQMIVNLVIGSQLGTPDPTRPAEAAGLGIGMLLLSVIADGLLPVIRIVFKCILASVEASSGVKALLYHSAKYHIIDNGTLLFQLFSAVAIWASVAHAYSCSTEGLSNMIFTLL